MGAVRPMAPCAGPSARRSEKGPREGAPPPKKRGPRRQKKGPHRPKKGAPQSAPRRENRFDSIQFGAAWSPGALEPWSPGALEPVGFRRRRAPGRRGRNGPPGARKRIKGSRGGWGPGIWRRRQKGPAKRGPPKGTGGNSFFLRLFDLSSTKTKMPQRASARLARFVVAPLASGARDMTRTYSTLSSSVRRRFSGVV